MSNSENVEKRLETVGVRLPTPPTPMGAYVPAVQSGNLVFCSGQGPIKDGKPAYVGRVGSEVTLEQGYEAAKIAAINCLAQIRTRIGSLDTITRVVQVRGFVNSAPDFHDQPKVINGASEFLLEVFGDAGKHARAALGTSNLPGNIPVEVEMVVEVSH
jgi:enamine deaminase RidA (YjgF/YER057c/UK114 family)